jgi:hypothetical protein
MLKITVELYPHGSDVNKETIAEILVGNTGLANERKEHIYKYNGWVKNESTGNSMLDERFQHEGFDGKFTHDRRDSIFVLIKRLMHAILTPDKE